MQTSFRAQHCSNAYRHVKTFLIEKGYETEIMWQEQLIESDICESHFLRESAWVILSTGMREAIVRKVFPRVSAAFSDWASAAQIVSTSSEAITTALSVFNHRRKIQAIADVAAIVYRDGFTAVKARIYREGVSFLEEFPYIGPITSFHLAKNLGMNVVKPDRHLSRVSAASGYASPAEMCNEIAEIVGDKVAVIDLVIWRYATIDPSYVDLFQCHRATTETAPQWTGVRRESGAIINR